MVRNFLVLERHFFGWENPTWCIKFREFWFKNPSRRDLFFWKIRKFWFKVHFQQWPFLKSQYFWERGAFFTVKLFTSPLGSRESLTKCAISSSYINLYHIWTLSKYLHIVIFSNISNVYYILSMIIQIWWNWVPVKFREYFQVLFKDC